MADHALGRDALPAADRGLRVHQGRPRVGSTVCARSASASSLWDDAEPTVAPAPSSRLAELGVDGNFVLQVGRIEARKNQVAALAAVERLDGVTLVVAGPERDTALAARLRALAQLPRAGPGRPADARAPLQAGASRRRAEPLRGLRPAGAGGDGARQGCGRGQGLVPTRGRGRRRPLLPRRPTDPSSSRRVLEVALGRPGAARHARQRRARASRRDSPGTDRGRDRGVIRELDQGIERRFLAIASSIARQVRCAARSQLNCAARRMPRWRRSAARSVSPITGSSALRQASGSFGGHDDAGVVDHLGQARAVGHDHRRAARHRLQGRQAEALVPGGMREHAGQVVDRRQVGRGRALRGGAAAAQGAASARGSARTASPMTPTTTRSGRSRISAHASSSVSRFLRGSIVPTNRMKRSGSFSRARASARSSALMGRNFGATPWGTTAILAAIDAEDVDDVRGGVLRNGDHHVCPQHGSRHHEARAQRLARRKPARVAVDREVVDRDDRRAADVAQRQHARRSEVRVRLELRISRGPLHVATDQPRPWHQPVGCVGHVHGRAARAKDDEPAVGPVDGHRMQDLRRVDARLPPAVARGRTRRRRPGACIRPRPPVSSAALPPGGAVEGPTYRR